MSSGLLQVFVELGNLHGTSNFTGQYLNFNSHHPYMVKKGIVRCLQHRAKTIICSPYDIRTVFTSGSTLRRYLFRFKPPTDFNMTKYCVYSIPCSWGKIYKGKTGHPLKVRLEEHRKAVVWGEIKKSGMADHIWKEKGNHLLLWVEVEIIDRTEHWRIRCLKESAHTFGYNDLLSRPSIELNTIWEPIIKNARWKKI